MNQLTAADMIKDARKSAGLTQAALAELAGINDSQICAYEQRRQEPSAGNFLSLLNACGYRVVAIPVEAEITLPGLGRIVFEAG